MKKFVILWIGLSVLCGSMPAAGQGRAEEQAAIRRVMERLDEAYLKRDVRALDGLMAEDFENWLGTDKGREVNAQAAMKELLAQKHLQYKRSDEVGIIFVSPDVAIYKAHWEFSGMTDAEGKAMPALKLLGASVMVKRNGQWLMIAFFSRPAGR